MSLQKKIFLIAAILIILVIFSVFAYFSIIPSLDASICYPRTANKIGGHPDFYSIADFIDGLLIPGMSDEEVLEVLNKVAPSKRTYTQDLPDGYIRYGYRVKICFHPFNQLQIIAKFTKDGIMVSGFVERLSP